MAYGQDETGKTISYWAGSYSCPVCQARPGERCTFLVFKRIRWQPDFFHTKRLFVAGGKKV